MHANKRQNWINTTIGEVLTFQRGFDITKKQQETGPHPVISSSGINSFHSSFKVNGPGVVIGRKGSLGTVFFIEKNYWPHDTTLWVKDFHGNDPKFAYYFLQIMHFEQYDCGASNPSLNRNHIHKIPVLYPNLPTQLKIAAILSAYDDLIENSTLRIKILEKMAQSLYREWFVNFRFPGHENVQMVDSPLGEIPKGWEYIVYSDLLESNTGGDWGEEEPDNKENYRVAIIRGTDFEDVRHGNNLRLPRRYISKSSLKKRRLQENDILIENSVNAKTRCTGQSLLMTRGILNRIGLDTICASFCKVFRLKKTELSPIAHLNLKYLYSEGKMEYYRHIATNGIGNFQATRFLESEYIVLPKMLICYLECVKFFLV